MLLKEVGLQLYSVREETEKDFCATVEKVAKMGYTGVEFAGYGGLKPAALAQLLLTRAAGAALGRSTVWYLLLDNFVIVACSEELAKLENAVERAAILCLGEYISERELPMAVSSAPKNNDAPTLAELQGAAGEEPISMTLDEMERAAILRTLQDTGDNKSEAARRLGITRATLHNKLRRYDME